MARAELKQTQLHPATTPARTGPATHSSAMPDERRLKIALTGLILMVVAGGLLFVIFVITFWNFQP
jgi:hypothetical protein